MKNNYKKNLNLFFKKIAEIIDPKIKEMLNLNVDKKYRKLMNYQIDVGGKR